MQELLWMSPHAPYDQVRHAGGKSHNYYIKYFQKTGRYQITLLSLCQRDEEAFLDLDSYGIVNRIFCVNKSRKQRIWKKIVNAPSCLNPFDRYAGGCLAYERQALLRALRQYKEEGHHPSLVVLQWTFVLLLWKQVRKLFPKARMIAIEEDVTFLGYERKWKSASNSAKRFFWKIRYRRMKQIELEGLAQSALIVLNNPKDQELLLRNHIPKEKTFVSLPYFERYDHLERRPDGKTLLFYGAMYRPENYRSVAWMAEEVMPLLDENIQLVVVGGNPDKSLQKWEGRRIHITGFVENVEPYLQSCLCMAAPLVLGAGIKVKVLEAMSAGIPVLTNRIGIEGIAAENGKEFFLCETPQEYAETVRKLMRDERLTRMVGEAARSYIRENSDLPDRLEKLSAAMEKLAANA